MSHLRILLLITLAFVVTGCGGSKKVSQSSSQTAATASASSDDVLTSAIYQLRPENFGLNSSTEKPVSLLNSWRFKRAEQQESEEKPVPVSAPEGWVTEEEGTRLAQQKFDLADCVFIRDSFFFHAIAGYLSDRGKDELQRVGLVVDFVCRNTSLWKADEPEVPLGPFTSLEFGRGSADIRAWICVEILRQLRMDSVIVRAKSDAKETTDKWLLGVIVGRKVHLYDMELGQALSGGSTDESAPAAAWQDIVAHPELLDQMATTEPYRLTIDDLKDPAIYVVADGNAWCHRMRLLELELPATETCVIYDPLIVDGGQGGLLHRIAAAGGWPVDSLKLWSIPKRQREAARNVSEAEKQEYQRLSAPLSVPIPYKKTDDGKIVMGTPEGKLQRYRLDHLLGRFADATQRYLGIRHYEVEPNPPELERIIRMASEDAFYWTGLCKVEMEDYPGAVEILSSYLKKYDRTGKWYFAGRSMIARCHAKLGQTNEAIKVLERTSSDDPYHLENSLRVKRWKAAPAK